MSDSKANTTITVTLPSAVIAKIKEVCRDRGCSESGVFQDALSIYLDNWEWYDTLLRNEENARSVGIGPDDVERLIAEYRVEVQADNRQQD